MRGQADACQPRFRAGRRRFFARVALAVEARFALAVRFRLALVFLRFGFDFDFG